MRSVVRERVAGAKSSIIAPGAAALMAFTRTSGGLAATSAAHAVEVRISDTGGASDRTLRFGSDGCVALTVERSVS
jgi:hypothetical protein